MAAPENQRRLIHEKWFKLNPPKPDQDLDIVVQALDEAINIIWDWVAAREANLASSLPQPFRGRTNRAEKYLLLCIMSWTQADEFVSLIAPEEATDG